MSRQSRKYIVKYTQIKNRIYPKDIFKHLAFTFNDKYGFLIIADADDLPAELASKFM